MTTVSMTSDGFIQPQHFPPGHPLLKRCFCGHQRSKHLFGKGRCVDTMGYYFRDEKYMLCRCTVFENKQTEKERKKATITMPRENIFHARSCIKDTINFLDALNRDIETGTIKGEYAQPIKRRNESEIRRLRMALDYL